MIYIGYNDAQKRGKVREGAKVLSYPNRKGVSLPGVVTFISEEDNEIQVDYREHGLVFLRLSDGRMTDSIETNVDINLVEIE